MLPGTVKIVKSRKLRSVGRVARIGRYKECMQNFGSKTSWEIYAWKIVEMIDNMELRQIVRVACEWFRLRLIVANSWLWYHRY
jgi:hypothetical protein